jgi:hypothetical protein
MTPEELHRRIEGFTDRDLLIEIYSNMGNLENAVHDLHKQIHGNGQPGLKDKVSKLEERTSPTKIVGISGALGAGVAALFAEILRRAAGGT